jgi:SET domain-containing protein
MHGTLRQPGRTIPGNPWVVIRGSAIHGRGLFARIPIPRGTRIIEYVGERITKAEGFRRSAAQIERNRRNGTHGAVYIFELNKTTDIDGNVSWNPARLINHSCEANCEAKIVRGRIWIEALRLIHPGEELSYDYGYDLDHWQEHPCRCGAPSCCKYIVRKNLRWRLARKLQAMGLNNTA